MIDPKKVAEKYNALEKIWDENDKWHLWTKHNIEIFVKEAFVQIPESETLQILNAGSAGYSYDLPENNILHIDIADKKLSNLSNAIIGDVQDLPIKNRQFDVVICVGSVINYCDPVRVINEFGRVLRPNGYLILEFENSYTLELLFTRNFNKKAVLIDSFHNGQVEKLWFFSERYIIQLLELSGLTHIHYSRFHILSPLIYRIIKNEDTASKFSKLDGMCRNIPFLRRFSSNTILFFQKAC